MSHRDPTDPPNIFSAVFLEVLRRLDEPLHAAEAEAAGPWIIVPVKRGFHLFRSWESEALGYEPEAWTTLEAVAFLLRAALPAEGREMLFALHDGPEGRQVLTLEGAEIGELRVFHSELLTGLHFLACVLRNPMALADLVQAAGPLTMEKVGQILYSRLAQDSSPD